LAAGAWPDPIGELKRSPDPLAAMKGAATKGKEEGMGGRRKGGRRDRREKRERRGRRKPRRSQDFQRVHAPLPRMGYSGTAPQKTFEI